MDDTGAVADLSQAGDAADVRESASSARHEAIAAALSRLATHQYGFCTSCGNPIPYGRLLVMPDATRCLTCSPRA